LGIGLILVVSAGDAERAMERLRRSGAEPRRIGRIEEEGPEAAGGTGGAAGDRVVLAGGDA
ncbi:MAG: hypothetical protein ACE5IM_12580, partial [Nitrospinota bacterium]